MEIPNNISGESIKKEQLLLLYDNLIDDGSHLYKAYKNIHKHLQSHMNRNIVQDMMKTKLSQCNELMDIYHELSQKKYVSKKIKNDKKIRLTKMFAKESNYAEMLNYVYANTHEIALKLKLTKTISDEHLILFRLLYLQSLIGINWEADNK